MAIVEPVLTVERQLKVRHRLPTDAGIDGGIARHANARQFAHKAVAQMLFKMPRQVNGRLDKDLVLRVAAVGYVWRWIQTVSILTNVHLQIAVRTEDLPTWHRFPIEKGLDAIRSTAHLVFGDEGIDHIRGHRASFQEGRPRL